MVHFLINIFERTYAPAIHVFWQICLEVYNKCLLIFWVFTDLLIIVFGLFWYCSASIRTVFFFWILYLLLYILTFTFVMFPFPFQYFKVILSSSWFHLSKVVTFTDLSYLFFLPILFFMMYLLYEKFNNFVDFKR